MIRIRPRTAYVFTSIAVVSIVAAMAVAQWDVGSRTSAQQLDVAPDADQPLSGPIDAQTFRMIADAEAPMVVNIRTESRRQTADLSEFFEGGELWERFFG